MISLEGRDQVLSQFKTEKSGVSNFWKDQELLFGLFTYLPYHYWQLRVLVVPSTDGGDKKPSCAGMNVKVSLSEVASRVWKYHYLR
jgi:hypothetical protein